MRIHVQTSRFVLESDRSEIPSDQGSVYIDSITGDVQLNQRASALSNIEVANADSHFSFGIIGSIRLLRGRYLVHCTKATLVTELNGHSIYKMSEADLIPYSNDTLQKDLPPIDQQDEEAKYVDMLKHVLNSDSFYFSYSLDLTHSWQRLSGLNSDLVPAYDTAQELFFWNKYLLSSDFSELPSPWTLVLIRGFIEVSQHQLNDVPFTYGLISRRGCHNSGTRFTRRGLDEKGNAANFCEQEQVVIAQSSGGSGRISVASFVQTRGSIPLVWQQLACLKWAPVPRLYTNDDAKVARIFNEHIIQQTLLHDRQVMINLVDQKGNELMLTEAFHAVVDKSLRNDLRLVSFDFHHECRRMQYQNISKLVDIVQDEFATIGYFHADMSAGQTPSDWSIVRRQQGVFRTNCMDCLDRTNVVQSVLASHVLMDQLQALQLHEGDSEIEHMPNFHSQFKNVWADNADAMSICYSGTPALKTDYTRTGQRTIRGALQDGKNSILRFYINNFNHGYEQDALDLFLGAFVVTPVRNKIASALPYRLARGTDGISSVIEYTLTGTLMLLCSMLFAAGAFLPPSIRPSMVSLLTSGLVLGPIISLAMVKRSGRKFVDKPKFVLLDTFEERDPSRTQTNTKVKNV